VKLVVVLTAALLALSAAPARAADKAPAAARAASATAVVPVKGMSCGSCVGHVNEALKKLDGVKSVDTNLDEARTTVVYDPAKLKPERIVKAIAAAGYEPGTPTVK
jgi:copper chaperone CopZ